MKEKKKKKKKKNEEEKGRRRREYKIFYIDTKKNYTLIITIIKKRS
jgi:hypothetical protein